MVVADFCELHTAREVSGHDVATGLVEYRLRDAWVSGAEHFPVAKGGVEGRDVGIAYKYGSKIDLGATRIEDVLGDDTCAQSGDVVAL
jgi:hypothetical protein